MQLKPLRSFLKENNDIKLLVEEGQETNDIASAQFVVYDSNTVDLNELTDFTLEGNPLPLRVIIHCWIHRNSSAADYLADCQAKKITNVSFLQRNELIRWLAGESETNQFMANESKGKNIPTKTEDETASSQHEKEEEVFAHERVLFDHNLSLRGSKPTNFQYLLKEAELKLVHSFKSSTRSKSDGVRKPDHKSSKPSTKKDPIILIPSAASSIFTIANIKQFLEESKFVNPKDLGTTQKDLVTVVKKFDRISKPIKFLIVNNTKLFTQPEYWNRVVAVFTTGHEWQFSSYQWSEPAELFQHCKGFYFHFSGDIIPKNAERWNVQKIELDKNKRFKDVEVLRFFWTIVERELLSRGYQ